MARQMATCENRRLCSVGPVPSVVFTGQPFDMWQESWRQFGMWHQRTVVVHRECNRRADHTKDGVPA